MSGSLFFVDLFSPIVYLYCCRRPSSFDVDYFGFVLSCLFVSVFLGSLFASDFFFILLWLKLLRCMGFNAVVVCVAGHISL